MRTTIRRTRVVAPLAIWLAGMAGLWTGCADQHQAQAERARKEAQKAAEERGQYEGSDDVATAERPRTPSMPSRLTLASGTGLVGSLQNSIDTGKNDEGDPVRLRTVGPVRVRGVTAVPAGSTIRGTCTHVDGAGRVAGGAELTIRWHELVTPDGRTYSISAVPLRLKGKGDAKESAIEIGGGAVAGGVLGAILGGKDDIAKGAAAGAVVGTGIAVATKGDQIVLPVGQKIQVTLDEPVSVTRSGA